MTTVELPILVLFMPLVALATAILSGTLGMGGGIILFATLIAYFDPQEAIVLHGLTALAALLYRSFTFRRHIRWQPVWYYMGGSLGGVALYSMTSIPLNRSVVAMSLGVMCLAGAVLPRVLKLNITNPWQALVAGSVNTFLSLAAGMAVGFIDLFFLRAPISRFEVLATKAALFVFACLVKSSYYLFVVANEDSPELSFLYVLPSLAIASIVGISLSTKVVCRISEKGFRRSSIAVLMVLGTFFLSRELVVL